MACEKYNLLKENLVDAMLEQDRAHLEQISSAKARAKRLTYTKNAVKLVEQMSRSHVQTCQQCKADGNKPLQAAPL